MSDEQIAKTLKYFWEVPDPITAPSQEIASSLGYLLLFSLWLDESSFLSWPDHDSTSTGEVESVSVPICSLDKPIILHTRCKFELPQAGEEAHAELIALASQMRGGHCHNSEENSKSPVYEEARHMPEPKP